MTALGLLALGHMWIKISKAAVAPGGEHRAERDERLARAGFFMTRHLAEVPPCLGRIRATGAGKLGRASCWERGCQYMSVWGVDVSVKDTMTMDTVPINKNTQAKNNK